MAAGSPPSSFVDAGDARLHVVEAGAGRPIILQHGFPDFWYVWRLQIRPLVEAGYRVIAPDLRGFNLSTKPATVARYRPSVLAEDLDRVAAHFAVATRRSSPTIGAASSHGMWRCRSQRWLRRLVILNSPHPVAMLRGLRRLEAASEELVHLLFPVAVAAGSVAAARPCRHAREHSRRRSGAKRRVHARGHRVLRHRASPALAH